MKKNALHRYHMLCYIDAIENCGIKEACNLLHSNKHYSNVSASKIFSSDKTNCNNIYNRKESFVRHFFQNIEPVYENGYFVYLNRKQEDNFTKIKTMTSINKSICDGEKSFFGKIRKHIEDIYPKETTKDINRNMIGGGKSRVANYTFLFKNEIRILHCKRLSYSDIFNENKILDMKTIKSNVEKKMNKSNSIDIITHFNPDFIDEVMEKIEHHLNRIETLPIPLF